MKNIFIISIIILNITFQANAGPGKTIISFMMGDVKIMRNNKKVNMVQGGSPQNGDIFNLRKKSILELKQGDGEIIRVKGPKIFVFNHDKLKSMIKKGSRLANMLSKLSKDTPPYYPHTIVSAVRKAGSRSDKLNNAGKKKLKDALVNLENEKYDEAWKLLDEVEKIPHLNRHARSLVAFYRAEIHFGRMEYPEALGLYSKLYRKKYTKFKYLEESLARAILCAHYSGNIETLAQLVQDYKKRYGNEGRYKSIIEAVSE